LITGVLIGGSILGINGWISHRDANRTALDAVDHNMRVAWSELNHVGATFTIDGDNLKAGDVVLNNLNSLPDAIVSEVGGNATIFMMDTRVATNIKKDDGSRAVGTKLAKNDAYGNVFAGKPFRGVVEILGKPYVTRYDPIVDGAGKVIGILFVGIATEQFFAPIRKSLMWGSLSGAAVMIAVIFLIAGVARRTISHPIKQLTLSMDTLAHGDLQTRIPDLGADEIGDMARALQVFKQNMANARELESEKAKEQKTNDERQAKIHGAIKNFQGVMAEIVKWIGNASAELQAAAKALTATAEETSSQAGTVATSSHQATGNVATVASASEELIASINEIAQQAARSLQVSTQAVQDATKAGTGVGALVEAAQKIGEVTSIISGLAEQTNLLALNATIEAARAGEAGKGFAVVASEVKSLANGSAKATEEITLQIASVQEISRNSARAIKDICGIIEEMSAISNSISASVQQQMSATQEIARSASEASRGTTEVSQSITSVSDAAKSNGASSRKVLAAAQELSQQALRLETEFGAFISSVESA
jgi:methyl-accepting chemotaxis protein